MLLRIEFCLSKNLDKVFDLSDLIKLITKVLALEFNEKRSVGNVVFNFSLFTFPKFFIDHELLSNLFHILFSLSFKSLLIVDDCRRAFNSLSESFMFVISFHFFSCFQLFLIKFELELLSTFFFCSFCFEC